MTTRKRRLHVWEHPRLHPEENKKSPLPIHVIFDDHEYDWYVIENSGGLLRVGLTFERTVDGEVYYDNKSFYHVSAGMYAKVWEEYYEEEPPPPPAFVEQGILFNQDEIEVPELGAREQFNQRLAPHIPLVPVERPIAVDLSLDEMPAPETHTVVMPVVPAEKIDSGTGVNLTHLARQVNPPLPEPPVNQTRLDLRSPMMLMPLSGQKLADSAVVPEPQSTTPEPPPVSGGKKDSE